jgi:pyrimidine operon attenuation protein / uracil phosphoribosyltransferase
MNAPHELNTAARLLSATEIQARIRRMAFQIWERNYAETTLHVLGIEGYGIRLAQALADHLKVHSPLQIGVVELSKTGNNSALQVPPHARVLLVDDVLHTGRTLYQSLVQVVAQHPAHVQLAVLVDRGHRQLPIAPDFVGLELATTLHDYVRLVQTPAGELECRLEYAHN